MVLGSTSQPSQPLISTRRGIAWGLGPRNEDSSVIVLTSPNRYYIDVRFALVGDPTAGPFWAFGGQVKYSGLSGLDDKPGVGIRGEWNHPIDSMGNTEGVDRADLFTLDNGDQIEVGLLENPETGKEDRFMEYWTSPTSTEAGVNGPNDSPYAVAVLKEGNKLVGMAIRVGDYAQGIRQSTQSPCGILVTRWMRGFGDWEKDTMSNDEEDAIPIQWLMEARTLGDIKSGVEAWTIVELST
jgi:hypothetical protein